MPDHATDEAARLIPQEPSRAFDRDGAIEYTPDERAAARRARADAESNDGQRAAGMRPAQMFIGRLAQVDLETLGQAIQTWRGAVANHGTAWYAAEGAVAVAMERTGRHDQQRALLRHIGELFLSRSWFTAAAPGARIYAAEPAAQYVATLAMLALLVRDSMRSNEFALLYSPFARIIPLHELDRE
jgi:hypothetical protein